MKNTSVREGSLAGARGDVVREVDRARDPVEATLRLAVALEFVGHGLFAIRVHPPWIPFITLFGFSESASEQIMPVVGYVDVLLAIWILIPSLPSRAVLSWMTFWGFFTALLRPLSGMSALDFIERGPNWGAPLALLLLTRSSTGESSSTSKTKHLTNGAGLTQFDDSASGRTRS